MSIPVMLPISNSLLIESGSSLMSSSVATSNTQPYSSVEIVVNALISESPPSFGNSLPVLPILHYLATQSVSQYLSLDEQEALRGVPMNISQAKAAIKAALINHATLREMLTLINVSGTYKVPMELNIHIITVKMG